MKESSSDHNDQKLSFFSERMGKILSITGLIVIALTILLYLIFGSWTHSWTISEEIIGQFGDFIGGFIGSVFSLAGVILFYVALRDQRRDILINQDNVKLQTSALEQQVKEFQAQKTELEETRKVYEEQTILIREQTNLYRQQNKELKEQSQTAKVQQFDSSFFSYLKLLNDYKNTLNSQSNTGNYFNDLINEIKNRGVPNTTETTIDEILYSTCKLYLELFNERGDKLSPYFKTLYRIMLLIDNSNIDEYKKWEYFKLLRSQLSDTELLVLNYNYHTDLGEKVRGLVVKYDFLKHLNILDKFEFHLSIPIECKYEIEFFLKSLGKFILDGINKYKSIENEEDISKSYSASLLELNIEIKLSIKDDMQFSLRFSIIELSSQANLNDDLIKLLIKRYLYTLIYMSKYIKKNESEISISTIEEGDKKEYMFKITNLDSL